MKLCGEVCHDASRVKEGIQSHIELLFHFHEAIRVELNKLCQRALALDGSSEEEIRALLERYSFLHAVYRHHSSAEDEVILPALDLRVKNVAHAYSLEHKHESTLFDQLTELLTSALKEESGRAELLRQVVCCTEAIQTTLRNHLLKEEKQVFPLLREHFSLKEQAVLVWQFMCCIPVNLMEEMLPWTVCSLPQHTQRKMLAHMLDIVPAEDLFQKVVTMWLTKRGLTSLDVARQWEKLTSRDGRDARSLLREVTNCPGISHDKVEHQRSHSGDGIDGAEKRSPINELIHWHNAIRKELETFAEDARTIWLSNSVTSSSLSSLVERYQFLADVCIFHCQAEDDIVFPAVGRRIKSTSYVNEHAKEGQQLTDVARLLEVVRNAGSESATVMQMVGELCCQAEAVAVSMNQHLLDEEAKVLPLLKQHFSLDEQRILVYQSLCSMPLRLLERFLPRVMALLNEEEATDMLNNMQLAAPEVDSALVTLFSWWARKGLCLEAPMCPAIVAHAMAGPPEARPDVNGSSVNGIEEDHCEGGQNVNHVNQLATVSSAEGPPRCSPHMDCDSTDRPVKRRRDDSWHGSGSSGMLSSGAGDNHRMNNGGGSLLTCHSTSGRSSTEATTSCSGRDAFSSGPSQRPAEPKGRSRSPPLLTNSGPELLLEGKDRFGLAHLGSLSMISALKGWEVGSTGGPKPIDHIFQFHKAIRKDLAYLDGESKHLAKCDDEFLRMFSGRFHFLWGLYRAHSNAEDDIVFPALEAKEALHNVSHSYSIDHKQEEQLFADIAVALCELSQIHRALVEHGVPPASGKTPAHLPSNCTLRGPLGSEPQAAESSGRGSRCEDCPCHAVAGPAEMDKLRSEGSSDQRTLACSLLQPVTEVHVTTVAFEGCALGVADRGGTCCRAFEGQPVPPSATAPCGMGGEGGEKGGEGGEKAALDKLRWWNGRGGVSPVLLAAGGREELAGRRAELAARLERMCRAVRVSLDKHVSSEEVELWPLFGQHFSIEEQDRIVGQIIGSTGAEVLQAMLPWVTSALTEEEQGGMMDSWRQATRHTMFDQWLSAWWQSSNNSPTATRAPEESGPEADPLKDVADYLNGRNGRHADGEAGTSELSARLTEASPGEEDAFNSHGGPSEQMRLGDEAVSSLTEEEELAPERGGVKETAAGPSGHGSAVNGVGGSRDGERVGAEGEKFKPGWQDIFRMNQQELEAAIRRVSSDSSLDPNRKSYLIQNLMTSRWIVAQQSGRRGQGADAGGSKDGSLPGQCASYKDEKNGIYGCEHYRRNCKVRAACCGQLFTCRFCHDKVSDHSMDRHATQEMMCMQCLKVQPVGQTCSSPECSGFTMARYFCSICKFFDDDERAIYHCPFCNLCRVGKGLGSDYFHCMTCNACMSISLTTHKCREKGMESNCPICHDFLFTSNTPVKALPCGHFMHSACFQAYARSHYTCPICCKSYGDMSVYFGMLDALLAAEELPDEYKGKSQDILCNDCEQKAEVPFHFVYHKCTNCGSYNTRTI